MPHLSPADYVVKVFGGVRRAARAIGCSPAAVSLWKKPKDKHTGAGCDGRVPGTAQASILYVAKRDRLDITSQDLIDGRTVRG